MNMREKIINATGGLSLVMMLIGMASIEMTPIPGLILTLVSGGYFMLYAYQNGGI